MNGIRRLRIHRSLVRVLPWLLAPVVAQAGPPFTTDDPVPTDYGHFEMYLFSDGLRTHSGTEGSLLGLEVNYGAAPDLQLSAELAQDQEKDETTQGDTGSSHPAVVGLGAKYRFVHESDTLPQVSFYPSAEIPGGGHDPSFFLPLWLQKSFGDWEVFGGGGLYLNPGTGNRNSGFFGVAALHPVTEHLTLGGELFRQTASSRGNRAEDAFNLAALYDFSDTWHVVASAGRSFDAPKLTNEFSYYVALELTF